MIRFEYVENGERIRHFSDMDMKIRQVETDVLYEEAVDYLPCRFTYEETDIPIDDTDATAEELVQILLGEVES